MTVISHCSLDFSIQFPMTLAIESSRIKLVTKIKHFYNNSAKKQIDFLPAATLDRLAVMTTIHPSQYCRAALTPRPWPGIVFEHSAFPT